MDQKYKCKHLKALASRAIENDDDDVATIKNIDIEAVVTSEDMKMMELKRCDGRT